MKTLFPISIIVGSWIVSVVAMASLPDNVSPWVGVALFTLIVFLFLTFLIIVFKPQLALHAQLSLLCRISRVFPARKEPANAALPQLKTFDLLAKPKPVARAVEPSTQGLESAYV